MKCIFCGGKAGMPKPIPQVYYRTKGGKELRVITYWCKTCNKRFVNNSVVGWVGEYKLPQDLPQSCQLGWFKQKC